MSEPVKISTAQAEKMASLIKTDESGCHVWQGGKRRGYGYIKSGGKMHTLHRLVFQWYNGFLSSKDILVRHICHNRACLNINHLLPGTHKDNAHDAMRANRNTKGESHGNAKLTNSQVLQIREHYGSMSQRELAKEYNMDRDWETND